MIDVAHLEWLRWTGGALLTAMLILGLFIVFKSRLGKQASISLHISSHPVFFVLMGLFLTIGGGVFYAFLVFWLVPTYHMVPAIYPILAIAFVAQLGLAWIPDKSPTTPRQALFHSIHFVCGAIVALAMVLSLVLLIFSREYMPTISGLLVVISAFLSAVCIFVYSFFKKSRQHFFIYEAVFILFFAAAMYSLILKI